MPRKESRILIAALLMLALVLPLTAFARTLEEEKQAVRDYLKVVDAKIVNFRNQGNVVKMKQMQSEKQATLKRWEALKAQMEGSSEETVSDSDLKEDLNLALAQLKGQIDKVASDNNDAKVSGEIRFAWTKGMQNVSTKNNFDISRAYVTVKKNLAGGAMARMTLDVSRISPSTNSPQTLFDYIKYAYVDIPVNVPAALQVIPFSMTAKLGLQHNMWIDWADKAWDNAWMMKQFDDNESVMSSADFGLGAAGKFTLPYLSEIEYHATLMNGGGYKAAESDSAKDIGIRLNTTLFKDDNIGTVIAGGYINSKAGIINSGQNNTKQAAILLGFQNDQYGKGYIEYLKGTKINGYSIGGYVFPAKSVVPVALVARYDNYDPDTTVTSSNDRVRSLIGAMYEYSKDIKLALDLQTYKSGSSAEQKTAYLHSVIYY
ncbi:MAG: hypothetical protein WC490_06140 [Candidatus Margulisiibacteriota bacterium]